jgi:hypothetical protein
VCKIKNDDQKLSCSPTSRISTKGWSVAKDGKGREEIYLYVDDLKAIIMTSTVVN